MRPIVICHMAMSVDGRILPGRWRPEAQNVAALYERVHEEMEQLIRAGKITYVGSSNFAGWDIVQPPEGRSRELDSDLRAYRRLVLTCLGGGLLWRRCFS